MPLSLAETCAIAVMAKAPRPGQCKTRLVPPLSNVEAAAMGAAFLRDITENLVLAARSVPIEGFAAYAPAGLEALFDGHLAANTRLVLADGGGEMPGSVQGLGRSLLQAARSLLAMGYGAIALLNSDSPTLPTAVLGEAALALLAPGERVVLGPAEDDGYYLIGMRQAHAHLFADIAWSTETVAEQTRRRVRELGLDLVEFEPWYDVDDVASLRRLLQEVHRAPCTADLFARLRLAERLAATAAA